MDILNSVYRIGRAIRAAGETFIGVFHAQADPPVAQEFDLGPENPPEMVPGNLVEDEEDPSTSDPAGGTNRWTDEEVETLKSLLEVYGNKWAEICKQMPGRTRIAVQKYALKHGLHKPSKKRKHWHSAEGGGLWKEKEIEILKSLIGVHGNKWVEISKRMPGRTRRAVQKYAGRRKRWRN